MAGQNRRLSSLFKTISVTYTSTAAALCADSAGNTRFSLTDVNWQSIVALGQIDSITGTSITFSILTSNKTGTGGTVNDVAATKANGSTALASASLNSTGTFSLGATGKYAADGSAAAIIGSAISVYGNPTSITAISASVDVYVAGM